MAANDEPEKAVGGRPNPKASAELEERRIEAWRLRVEEGRTYTDIAMLMACSVSTAYSYVQATLASKRPSDEDVEEYRASLVATALSRSELAFERADQLYADAADQTLILEGPRGGVIISTLAPQLYGRAAAWEQRGGNHLDRVARWTGVDVAGNQGPDPDGVEGSIAAEAERFLGVLAEIERKRLAAEAAIATVGANGATPASNGAGPHG